MWFPLFTKSNLEGKIHFSFPKLCVVSVLLQQQVLFKAQNIVSDRYPFIWIPALFWLRWCPITYQFNSDHPTKYLFLRNSFKTSYYSPLKFITCNFIFKRFMYFYFIGMVVFPSCVHAAHGYVSPTEARRESQIA